MHAAVVPYGTAFGHGRCIRFMVKGQPSLQVERACAIRVPRPRRGMRNLQEYVDDYVPQLSGPKANDAWHSLVEAGPAAVKAFDAVRDPDVMISLVRVISEYRSAEAVPFFETLLRDRDAEIWKAALDGLVMTGGNAALDVLDVARSNATAEKLEWIDEAVGQIREAQRPTRGCT